MMLQGMTAQMLLRSVYPVASRRHDPDPCRGRRGRADPVPMGGGARRDGDRHRRHRGQGRTRPRPRLRPPDRLYAARISSPRSTASPAARSCRWSMIRSASDTFLRSLDCLRPRGHDGQLRPGVGPDRAVLARPPGAEGLAVPDPPDPVHLHRRPRPSLQSVGRRTVRDGRIGKVKIEVKQRFALADAAEAHRALEARQTSGSTMLTV